MHRVGRRLLAACGVASLLVSVGACGDSRPATPEAAPGGGSTPFVGKLSTPDGMSYGALAFSPDGKLLAAAGRTASNSSTVRLWSTTSGKRVGDDFAGQREPVRAMDFSPDSALLTTAGADGKIRFYDPGTRKSRGEFQVAANPAFLTFAFSPDSRTMAVTGTADGLTTVHQVPGGQAVGAAMAGRAVSIDAVAFHRDGRDLTVVDPQLQVRRWSLDNHQLLSTVDVKGPGRAPTLSPDGTLVAATSFETIRLYDTTTGALAGEFGPGAGHWNELDVHVAFSAASDRLMTFGAEDPQARAVAASPTDKERITVRIWDRAGGKQLRDAIVLPASGQVVTGRFSPDGNRVAVATGSSIQIFTVG